MNFSFFTVFLKNRNISSKIKRSKVTDYAALRGRYAFENRNKEIKFVKQIHVETKNLSVVGNTKFGKQVYF